MSIIIYQSPKWHFRIAHIVWPIKSNKKILIVGHTVRINTYGILKRVFSDYGRKLYFLSCQLLVYYTYSEVYNKVIFKVLR